MGSWNSILIEIHAERRAQPGVISPSAEDVVRKRHLTALADFTGRPTIVYATAFLETWSLKSQADVSMHAGDKQGFKEVTQGLRAGPLDVILHAPGGTAEAAEGIAQVLRSKFTEIRFIVPVAAKSAATILAMAGSAVVMDDTSELGPIDPQRQWVRRIGATSETIQSPMWAIQQEWKKIDDEIRADPSQLPKWYPIISQFGPSLLVECDIALALSRSLVEQWLRDGMFSKRADPAADASRVADSLANHGLWQSHARMIGVDDAIGLGIEVVDLRRPENADLSDKIWSAWHAISLTLDNTGAIKIFENSLGDSKVSQIQTLIGPSAPGVATPAPRLPVNQAIRPRRRR